ncbi:hypothetical protein BDV96DRAFT_285798 [Lophiotrema nucula]|uniref:Protein prenyltransferase n=1 Tax=Lophiotrema nucula TaxID=690887 RepID=A0A6A5YNG2_9PLEO|nr:hypothetical protein BDV96DRAFT_285798 [Lophiotrema nucula]
MESKETQGSNLQKRAYYTLNGYFSEHEDDVVEIEMLPPQMKPDDGALILHEGRNLGIPKDVLVMAFLHARQLFFVGYRDIASTVSLNASGIVLLSDPEHLTAAHFRKRRLLHLSDTEAFEQLLNREHNFLNSVLTSPLHRQSKSPTLWYHRLWVSDLLLPFKLLETSRDQFLSFIRSELDAVFKAGGHHPKNYYAWQYARRLFVKVDAVYQKDEAHLWKSAYPAFLVTCALLVKSWCLKHTSDISGWMFLLFLLPRLQSVPRRRRIVGEVLEWAMKVQSEQESLWVFLRYALADTTLLQDERDPVLQQLLKYQKEQVDGKPSDRISMKATAWIETHVSPM